MIAARTVMAPLLRWWANRGPEAYLTWRDMSASVDENANFGNPAISRGRSVILRPDLAISLPFSVGEWTLKKGKLEVLIRAGRSSAAQT